MAIITAKDCAITRQGDRLRLRIGGKAHLIEPAQAILLSNALGNAAVDSLHPETVDRIPFVTDLLLAPPGADGRTLLRFQTSGGPMIVALDQRTLTALSQAATGALEHGIPRGSA